MLELFDLLEEVRLFVQSGGVVLVLIAILAFVMWILIFERIWFFNTSLRGILKGTKAKWEQRNERQSWNAHQVREALVSKVRQKIDYNLDLIATMVALCPLMGLLGTVSGMIDVFNVLAITGGGDAKSMASGVSKATIPTMAGMVAAISGVFGSNLVKRIAMKESQLFDDQLTMDH